MQYMKREKSYRMKSKNKIHFKVCNPTTTELCQIFNDLSSINSNSSLRNQLAHCPGHPYSWILGHSLCRFQNVFKYRYVVTTTKKSLNMDYLPSHTCLNSWRLTAVSRNCLVVLERCFTKLFSQKVIGSPWKIRTEVVRMVSIHTYCNSVQKYVPASN